MSSFWKSDILSNFHHVWSEGENRELCGIMMDPVTFIPVYLGRFLIRQEMEERLPPPGYYKVEFKVKRQLSCTNDQLNPKI